MLASPDLIAMHEMMLDRFGGMRGITEAGFGRLEGAVAAPLASAFGAELFPGPKAKAAALCYAISKAHPFSDGNKRVALVAMDVLLATHGITLTATNDQAFEAMMALANGQLSRDALIAWVEANSGE